MINTGSASLPIPVPTKGSTGIINPPEKYLSLLLVTCEKCGHQAEAMLSPEQKKRTDKLVCSQCGARGMDLLIRYLESPSNFALNL